MPPELTNEFNTPPTHNVGNEAAFQGFFDTPKNSDGSVDWEDFEAQQDPLRGYYLDAHHCRRNK